MSFYYTEFFYQRDKGNLDLSSDDIRVALVMSNTTADTDEDAQTMDDIGTLDEYDGSGYSRQALASEAVTRDTTNDQSVFDADDALFSSLGAGTRNCVGAIIYLHVTDDSDSIPLAYIDDGGFPFAGDGTNFTIQWDSDGIFVSKNDA